MPKVQNYFQNLSGKSDDGFSWNISLSFKFKSKNSILIHEYFNKMPGKLRDNFHFTNEASNSKQMSFKPKKWRFNQSLLEIRKKL